MPVSHCDCQRKRYEHTSLGSVYFTNHFNTSIAMIKSYQLIAKDIPNGLWVALIVGIILRLFAAAFIEVSSLNEASWFKVPVVPFDIPPSLSQSHYQECQFLREEMGLNAYSIGSNSDLGSFHHNCHAMPLMVSCFAGLPRFGFILIDVFTAIMLYAFAASIVKCPSVEEREKISEVKHCPAKIRPSYGWIYDITNFSYDDTEDKGSLCDKKISLIKWCNVPLIISTCFLVSPFAIFASAYRSLQSFMILVQISAIFSAREGNLFATGLLLAVATYVDVYPFVYLLPLSLLTSKKSPKNNLLRLSVFFTVSIAVLLGISFVLNDWSWAFTKSVYGWNMQSRDTQPNFGILWYTFIMGFQRFRKFYVVLFAFYPYIFVIPIYLRLKSSAFEMVSEKIIIVGNV